MSLAADVWMFLGFACVPKSRQHQQVEGSGNGNAKGTSRLKILRTCVRDAPNTMPAMAAAGRPPPLLRHGGMRT